MKECLEKSATKIRDVLLAHQHKIEEAYLNAGDDKFKINLGITIEPGAATQSYKGKVSINYVIDREKGDYPFEVTPQMEFEFDETDWSRNCECADPRPISIDGASFICFSCLHPFNSEAAGEYFRILLTHIADPEFEKSFLLNELSELTSKKRKSKKDKARIDEIRTELAAMDDQPSLEAPKTQEQEEQQTNLAAGGEFF